MPREKFSQKQEGVEKLPWLGKLDSGSLKQDE